MSRDDSVYFLRREFEERVLAAVSPDVRIAEIHRQLAELYGELLAGTEPQRPAFDAAWRKPMTLSFVQVEPRRASQSLRL